MNEHWELDANGKCQPGPNKFELDCQGSGMTVKLSSDLVPNAIDVSLAEECAGVYDSDGEGLKYSL